MTSLIGLLFFLGLLSSMGLELDCLHLSLGLNILFGRLSAIASFCNLLGMLSTGPLLKSSCFFLQQHIQNPVKFYRKLPIICAAGGSYVLQLIRCRRIGPNFLTIIWKNASVSKLQQLTQENPYMGEYQNISFVKTVNYESYLKFLLSTLEFRCRHTDQHTQQLFFLKTLCQSKYRTTVDNIVSLSRALIGSLLSPGQLQVPYTYQFT